MSERRRWPASVFGHGSEPDPRFTLANERTFLAWVRTALALLVGAAALDALDLPMPDRVQSVLAALLALGALVVAGTAWGTWAATERAMREGRPLPGSPAMVVLVGLVAVVGLVLVVTSFA